MGKSIVIIGAGFFGCSLANRLVNEDTEYNVKIITLSDYVYFLISSIRVAVYNEPEGTVIPLKEIIDPRVEVLKDDVVDITETEVHLQGSVVPFDALVIATGAKWPDPISSSYQFKDNYKEYFTEKEKEIKEAKSIVLIGGGFNNVELAGELSDRYDAEMRDGKKKIILIHSSDLLLRESDAYAQKTRQRVTDHFRNNTAIELVLGKKAIYSDAEPQKVKLESGEEIITDLVYHQTGVIASVPPNSLSDITDSKGFIKINLTMQVLGYNNVFAIGDVTDFEQKELTRRVSYLNTLQHNIRVVVRGSGELKRTQRPVGVMNAIVSMGKHYGVGQFKLPLVGIWVTPNWFARYYKSKSLFVPLAKQLIGKS